VRPGHYAARRFSVERLDPRVLLTGDVFVTVLHDANGNGLKDPEEPPLTGWTVFVDYDRDGILDASEPSGLTDIDGETLITGVPQGTWDVRQVLEPGWTPATNFDVVDRVGVDDNETTDVLFMNVAAANGSVEGTVWQDINGDGIRQAEDTGLPGWIVFVDDNGNKALDAGELSDVTDATGAYALLDIATGQHKVREIVEPGWDTTLGQDAGVTVDIAPATTTIVDFGNFSTAARGSISGTVFNDVNADGVRAPGDAGMEGWTVFLDTNGNSAQDSGEPTSLTDGLGFYSFPSLIEGPYRVAEILQSGWNISPGYAVLQTVTVVGDNNTAVNFGNWTPTLGSISGRVWNDLNGDGLMGGEPGLPGWTVFLDQDSDGTITAGEPTTVTTTNGDYTLSNVPIGGNLVREVLPIGWQATAPGTGVQLANVPNGSNVPGVNFGNKQRTDGRIRGVIYADYNKNNLRDPGERGLPGITVFLDTNDNNSLDAGEPSSITMADLFYTPSIDEAGMFEFTHLGADTFHVREIPPVEQSATPLGSREQTVLLLPGEDRVVNFGNIFRNNEIHGTKFNDLNGNHQLDPGEPGIGGVTIYIDADRDNVMDPLEARTRTAADGTYEFTTDLTPGSYVVRERVPLGCTQTYPQTIGGTLWPAGVSHPAVGDVSPTSITASLAIGQTHTQTVSLTLPTTGALTNMVDVFLLFDDTGSFTNNSPIVRAAFPQIISSLQAALPGLDLGFGVGRFEEYANFAAEYSVGRPFILNQPIVAQTTTGFSTAIQNALDRVAPGYGGDLSETDIEALFQLVTGHGFDGNNNGTFSDSGAAGLASTQITPGPSGDVPSFASYIADLAGGGLPAAGVIGGAGFRAGALPIVLIATDTGFAYQPKGETSITGVGGLTLPLSALTQSSRPTTPFSSGAGIQETITALNALGALVIGLGTNATATAAPRSSLEAIAKLTGAVNNTLATIANGTLDPIAFGDPFYFQIASGFSTSVVNGIVAAITNAATSVSYDITLRASDPRVHLSNTPGVVNGVGAGQTATFDVTLTGDGRPYRFDLQFVRQGTDVVLGSIPVVLGTPIIGNGYEYGELEDGEIDDTVDFGNQIDPLAPLNVAPSFTKGPDISVPQNPGPQEVLNWATNISAGPPSEASQILNFIVSNDSSALFLVQPSISPGGTLTFSPSAGAFGTATVTVQLEDDAGTINGGADTSAPQTFTITIQPLAIASNFDYETRQAVVIDFSADVGGSLTASSLLVVNVGTGLPVTPQSFGYDSLLHRATVSFDPAVMANADYRLTIPGGTLPGQSSLHQLDFFILAGDANRDRKVDVGDLGIVATSWQQSPRTFSQGDFDYNGSVNVNDLGILATNWQATLAASGAPVGAAAPSLIPRKGSQVRSPFSAAIESMTRRNRRSLVEDVELTASV
jgi:hypothetical protein